MVFPNKPRNEVARFRLTDPEWQSVLAAAAELDLVHGGYFRVRETGMQFYCSPENAPPGWEYGFAEGSPDIPRALVGEASVSDRIESGWVSVVLRATIWGAVRPFRERLQRAALSPECLAALMHAMGGRLEDRAWLMAQFERLREHAAGRLIQGS